MNAKSAVLILLLVAVAVLAFLYYRETQDNVTISVDPPKVEIK